MSTDPSVTVSLLFGATHEEQAAGSTVVWLHAEHDASNIRELSEAIRRAVYIDGTHVILDLSDVTFMCAATVGVIVEAKSLLDALALTLRLRRPSRYARRIIELCNLSQLFEGDELNRDYNSKADALRSWVAVPALPRAKDPRDSSVDEVSAYAETPMMTPDICHEPDEEIDMKEAVGA